MTKEMVELVNTSLPAVVILVLAGVTVYLFKLYIKHRDAWDKHNSTYKERETELRLQTIKVLDNLAQTSKGLTQTVKELIDQQQSNRKEILSEITNSQTHLEGVIRKAAEEIIDKRCE